MLRLFFIYFFCLFVLSLGDLHAQESSLNQYQRIDSAIAEIDKLSSKKPGIYHEQLNKYLRISQNIQYSNGLLETSKRLGAFYFKKNSFKKSLIRYQMALKSAKRLSKTSAFPEIYENMVACFAALEEYDKALEMQKEAIEYYKNQNDRRHTEKGYRKLSNIYQLKGEEDKALEYFNKSSQYSNFSKRNTDSAVFGKAKDSISSQLKNYALSLEKFISDFEYSVKDDETYQRINTVNSKAELAYKINDFEKANKLYDSVIAMSAKEDYEIPLLVAYEGKSRVLVQLDEFDEAFQYYENYIKQKDALYKKRLQMALKAEELARSEALRKAELEYTKKEKQLAQERLRARNTALIFVIAFIISLAGVFILLLKRYKDNKKISGQLEKTNAKLKESEKQLEQNVQTKDKFFSIIAHDLKGPINSLNGFLTILKEHPEVLSTEEIKKFGNDMDKSVKNLSQLLNSLLQWAMAQSGQLEFKPKKVDVQKIFLQIQELYKEYASTKQQLLKIHNSTDSEIIADENMLYFIMRNLVQNAIKFTPNGGSVILKAEDLNEEEVKVAVIDTGVGMGEGEISKLFTLESKLSSAGTNNEKGTGLGLILTQEFLNRHETRMSVKSTKGRGSEFSFILKKALAEIPEGYFTAD